MLQVEKDVVQREVYRVYASEKEKELKANLLSIDNGTLFVACADIDATNCADEFYIHAVLFRGWHILECSTAERFKLYYVHLEPEQLSYKQLRSSELTLSDLIKAKHYEAFELIERVVKVGENA